MGFFNTLYWKLYPGINTKVVYLQKQICGFHLSEDTILKQHGLSVRQIDYDNESDLLQWCDIINNSYDDCYYDIPKARILLKNHPLFTNNKTAIFYNGINPYATVSWGGYKCNSKIGGDFRIGVRNEFKGKGYGRMCVEYAYSQLAAEGFELGESVITIKRKPSVMLHFSLGFVPQYKMKYVTHKSNLKYINLIQRLRLTYRLSKYYHQYKKRLSYLYL